MSNLALLSTNSLRRWGCPFLAMCISLCLSSFLKLQLWLKTPEQTVAQQQTCNACKLGLSICSFQCQALLCGSIFIVNGESTSQHNPRKFCPSKGTLRYPLYNSSLPEEKTLISLCTTCAALQASGNRVVGQHINYPPKANGSSSLGLIQCTLQPRLNLNSQLSFLEAMEK